VGDFERVFLYHMRRAGGTSLRWYCRHLAEAHKMAFDVVERFSLDYHAEFVAAPSTLHVVSLRDPIDRIKSAYRFEGRWPQRQHDRTIENAQSFADWADSSRDDHRIPNVMWDCTRNYYTRALIGYPAVGAAGLGRAELELAKERLEEFEIVLVTEQFNDLATRRYLQTKLDFLDPVPHRRYPELPSPPSTDEELFDEPTLRMFEDENALDFELHEHARSLLRRRIATQSGLPQQ